MFSPFCSPLRLALMPVTEVKKKRRTRTPPGTASAAEEVVVIPFEAGNKTYQPCCGGEFPKGRERNMNIAGGKFTKFKFAKFTEFTLDSRVV